MCEERTSVPGVCNYGYVPLSHQGNIVSRIETTTTIFLLWTDARRPVQLPWIRSAEVRGKRRYNGNAKTTAMFLLDGRTAPRTAAMDTFAEVRGNVVMRMGTQQQQPYFFLSMDGSMAPRTTAMDTFAENRERGTSL